MTTYEQVVKEFEWDVPEKFNFAWDVVHERAIDNDKVALITVNNDGTEASELRFSDLDMLSNKMANILISKGIKKGDRVMIMLPRCEEFYISILGAMKIGAVFMPTPTLAAGHDIDYRINRSEAVMCIANEEGAEKVDVVLDKVPTLKHRICVGSSKDWEEFDTLLKGSDEYLKRGSVEETLVDDPLLVYFTSGTTGNPKMVRHTNAYPIGHTVTARFTQDLKEEDIIWAIADTGWAKTAWGKLFGQWIVGATIVQWAMTGRFDPDTVLKILQDKKVSVFCSPPTAYRMMVANCDLKAYDLSALRHSLSAGEPLNPEIIDTWEEATGSKIYDYYGQTETVALVGNYRFMPIRPGSMGKPTPGHNVEIMDDDGKPVPVGEEGHIAVKVKPFHPPGIFHGYWKDEEKSADVFDGDWYYTGDKAYKDEDGYFWFVGRSDDVIKASGYRIGPFEVESALQEHDSVQESAVIGVPDKMRGQIVKAFIILAPGYVGSDKLVAELQEHVRTVTAPYKYPREIEFVEELPKTISGKIKRKDLRKMEKDKRGDFRL